MQRGVGTPYLIELGQVRREGLPRLRAARLVGLPATVLVLVLLIVDLLLDPWAREVLDELHSA